MWLVLGAKPGTKRYSSAISRYVATSCTPISLRGHAMNSYKRPLCSDAAEVRAHVMQKEQEGLCQGDTHAG